MPATPRQVYLTKEDLESYKELSPMELARRNSIRYEVGESAEPFMSGENQPDVWKLRDLKHRPKPQWLINQIVEENGLTIFFGPDKIGKTVMLSSMLWAWTAGMDHWLDRTFKMRDPSNGDDRKVVYLLLEGQASFYDRFNAWADASHIDESRLDNFYVIDEGISIFDEGMRWDDKDTWPLTAMGLYYTLEQLRPAIFVVDTLSRATAGMNENSPQMAQVVGFLDLIRDSLGIASIIVHHTALDKSEAHRPRGHSSLKGAASSYVRIQGEAEKPHAKLIVGPHRNAAAENPQHSDNDYGYYFLKKAYKDAFIVASLEHPRAQIAKKASAAAAVSRKSPRRDELLALIRNKGPMSVGDAATAMYGHKTARHNIHTLVKQAPELTRQDGIISELKAEEPETL